MPRPDEPAYVFRPVEERDFPLLRRWLGEPHVAAWWGEDAEASLAEIREGMESVSTEPLIVEWKGKPLAYLQSYDPHLEDDHPYADQPFGTLGLDLTVGPPELVGKGHGPAILDQFAETLFDEGAPRLVIDPDPGNLRAIRAYEKAGFRPLDRRSSVYGDALLMVRDNPDFEA